MGSLASQFFEFRVDELDGSDFGPVLKPKDARDCLLSCELMLVIPVPLRTCLIGKLRLSSPPPVRGQVFDSDGSGSMTTEEFCAAMKKLVRRSGEGLRKRAHGSE